MAPEANHGHGTGPVLPGSSLTAQPKLGGPGYVFPVYGPVSFSDTYGAFRGDVPGNWHHGDDVFAPLGAPILACSDGIVAKREDQAYLSGERGWVKVKHRTTADCVVGGYRVAKDGQGVGSLLLGLYDGDGVLHYVGHTSSFKAAERRQLRELLAPLEGGESFGGGRAPGGPSRWSGGRDTEWVDLSPSLVCEVSFDRVQYGRFRHAARFERWRSDRDPRSCTFEQLGIEPPNWA